MHVIRRLWRVLCALWRIIECLGAVPPATWAQVITILPRTWRPPAWRALLWVRRLWQRLAPYVWWVRWAWMHVRRWWHYAHHPWAYIGRVAARPRAYLPPPRRTLPRR